MSQTRIATQGPVVVLLVALVAAAWAALWAWQQSSFGSLMLAGHGSTEWSLLALAAFPAAWTLMVVAMMLPSALPFILEFEALAARQWGHRVRPVALLLAGYASAWLAYGIAGYLGYRGLGLLTESLVGPQNGPGVLLQASLLVAGAYQFTPWKRSAMGGTCSPGGMVGAQQKGSGVSAAVFALGVRYGEECLGRCWALMLLMFAAGGHDLTLMLVLGMVAAAEKNTEWAARLSRPLGGFLIGIALSLALASAMGVSYVHSHG
jgi:predicted metal-binding membrane protein